MIRHIVSWNFVPTLQGAEKEEIRAMLTQRMRTLKDAIPCVTALEVFSPPMSSSNCEFVLYTELRRAEDLPEYQNHPEHQKIIPLMQTHCCDRRCVDISMDAQ